MSFGEGNLHARVDELERENSELCDENAALCERRMELERENAELRELVRCYADVPCRCAYCEYDKRNDGEEGCKLFDRAIALGIDL